MASVSFVGICKSFGRAKVIRNLSLDIRNGEFIAVVGPSGCGKSTLLRILAGLETPEQGDVLIDGVRVNDWIPKNRDIAMVFQNYALYPQMTVRENLGFSLRMRKTEKSLIESKVREAAAMLSLTPLLERLPGQLSGGQRQRVAMGRAIVRNPKVFLFDEPLSNLDAKLRLSMRTEIKSLHRRLGATSIYVTHDQAEAMSMADRIVVMNGGEIDQADSPSEIYHRPKSLFVAGFIGAPSMNMLEARYTSDNGPDRAVLAATGTPLDAPGIEPTPDELVAGIRPEHLTLQETPGPFTIPAVIEEIEPLGADTLVITRSGNERVDVLVREDVSLQVGAIVHLSPRAGAVHLFDKTTGRALRPELRTPAPFVHH